MPTYEYACRNCEEHLEIVQSFRDEPLTVCPSCGGDLRKVFGAIGIAFKGSGFYKTDSRTASGGDAKKAAEKAAGGDSKSGDSKSGDSKAARSSSGDGAAPRSSKPDTKPASDSSKAAASS